MKMDIFRSASGQDSVPEPPHGEQVGLSQRVVARHADHRAARQTLAVLDDAGFETDRAVIVGSGLKVVERGRGQLSTADVTGRGVVSGLLVGALVGYLLALLDVTAPMMSTWWLVVNAGIMGGVLGAAAALVGYVATRGHRWFIRPAGIQAEHYDVLVDADAADQAVRLLRTAAARSDGPAPDGAPRRGGNSR